MNRLDIFKWSLHKIKEKKIMLKGARKGYLGIYDEELLTKLRNIYYGGLPASILLLHSGMCNGKCYDRATLLAYALDYDYEIVYANINTIKLNPLYVDYCKENPLNAEHVFVEVTDENNMKWVYDTSIGLIIEKDLYYKIEKPVVRHRNSKEKNIKFMEEQLANSDIENDKYMSALMIPMLEYSLEPINIMYEEQLKKEIEIFKQRINYDNLNRHIDPRDLFDELRDNSKVLKK